MTPSLPAVLHGLRHTDGLAVFDVGSQWTVITWGAGEAVRCQPGWQQTARSLLTGASRDTPLPFAGGLVGWLGYESGRTVERMPQQPAPRRADDLLLWRTEGGLCLNHRTGTWHMAGQPDFIEQARAALSQAQPPRLPSAPGSPSPPPAEEARHYTAGVRALLAEIAAGEVYQTCLAWEQTGRLGADPLLAWLALRKHNPALRGAWLRHGETILLSNSPELFLSVQRRGERLTARSVPIKGTVRCTEGIDGRLMLWESEKERAELTMIVDLVRNDLGRIAHPGSVHAAPRTLRRCGDLLHAEQAVTATLRQGADALDAISAAFPPGSVTGAPKVAAMAQIGRLERTPRGVYTGAIGFVTDDGQAHFSVAIRTATVQGNRYSFHVGAGIVADSQPQQEWRETLAKGHALAAWLEAT